MSCPFFVYSWQSLLLFALAGVALGAVGGGGALLALPIFLYVLHVPGDLAVSASTAVVGTVALLGAWEAWRRDGLDLGTLARFALPGAVFSALGAWISTLLPARLLGAAFAALVAASAARLLLRPPADAASSPSPSRLVATGAGTGALMGLFGAGGGFLAVPALRIHGGLPLALAVPVSLGSIALNAAAGLAVQIPSGHFRWTIALPAFLAMMLGQDLGSFLGRRVAARHLERALGALLVAVAALLAWKVAGG